MNSLLSKAAKTLKTPVSLFSMRRLLSEVEAYVPLLPVLSKQLRDTSADLSHEIGGICVQFHEMAGGAKQSVKLVSNLLGGNEGNRDVHDIIQDCRNTMLQLLDRLDRGNALYVRAIAQMEKVNASAAEAFSILGQVEKTSFANKLIALNAKIEAGHLGDLGSGFEVVAEEISVQATRSSQLTEKVAQLLTTLTQSLHTATSELKSLAEQDRSQAEASRKAVTESLESLESASSHMQETLKAAGDTTEKLVEGITKAVIGLQFQDRVTQRLEHVVQSLDSMAKSLTEEELQKHTGSTEDRKRAVSEALLSSYTMDSERLAHNVPVTATTPSEGEGGDVELF